MHTHFKIQDFTLNVDLEATRQLYAHQMKIVDSCPCEDCRFYATVLIKENIEIFQVFTSMGIDLEKNISPDSPGVWCVLDDQGSCRYCEQDFRLVGHILPSPEKIVEYNRQELGFEIRAVFADRGEEKMDIYLTIEMAKS